MDVLAKIRRDLHLPAPEFARRAVRAVVSMAAAPIYLRRCDVVGPFARALGRPIVRNRGRIEIGAECGIGSEFAPVLLEAGPAGRLSFGQRCFLNFGSIFSAQDRVTVGDESRFGPYVIVSDSDGGGRVRPIEIGSRVWVATRAVVLPGVRIGDGSVIMAGSVVCGAIPPGVIAGGVPARVIRPIGEKKPRADDDRSWVHEALQ